MENTPAILIGRSRWSETSLIVLTTAGSVGLLSGAVTGFWTTVTAIGLTVTPVLAAIGKRMGRRVEHQAHLTAEDEPAAGRTIIFGFG